MRAEVQRRRWGEASKLKSRRLFPLLQRSCGRTLHREKNMWYILRSRSQILPKDLYLSPLFHFSKNSSTSLLPMTFPLSSSAFFFKYCVNPAVSSWKPVMTLMVCSRGREESEARRRDSMSGAGASSAEKERAKRKGGRERVGQLGRERKGDETRGADLVPK